MPKLRRLKLLLVLTALLVTVLLIATSTLALEAHAPELDVTRLAGGPTLVSEIEVLEDISAQLSLFDVSRGAHAVGFKRATSEALFGFTHSAFWLRFSATNASDRLQPWLLELPFPHLDSIDLYALHEDGHLDHVKAGDLLPFSARALDLPTFVFPQQAAPHERTLYYLRAESNGSVRVPLRAWLTLDFVSHESRRALMLWLFYGAAMAMVCYNLGVAALLRRREYLLNIGVLLSVAGAIFTLSGQMFQHILPNSPAMANRALAVCLALGLLFIQLYSLEVTRPYERLSSLVRLYRYTLPPAFLLVPISLFCSWGLRAAFVVICAYLPFGFYKLCKVLVRGRSELLFHCLSFSCLALSIPVAMAAHAKLLPPYPIAIWAAHFGCAAYAVLSALALPVHINVMSDRLARLNLQLSLNVSSLKLALTRAEQATDEAHRATKVKDEFMATMSHELRTPLNAIINVPQGLLEDFPTTASAECSHCGERFVLDAGEHLSATTKCEVCQTTGALREGKIVQYVGDPAHTARFLHKIERSGQHLLRMVNGVLDFSKMEAGHLELVLEPLDLRNLLAEAVDSMNDLAARRALVIELLEADATGPAWGDAVRLRQVLLNLLSNAIKFSEPGGKIEVTWERSPEADTVSIKDSGIGIALENHERIFASFEQVHKGDTRKYGGTGLGLSISRSLVRMHGGELWVESSLGAGSTFRFRIPRMASAESSAA